MFQNNMPGRHFTITRDVIVDLAHHSVRIYDSNVDNIETLYRLRRVSGRPADYT